MTQQIQQILKNNVLFDDLPAQKLQQLAAITQEITIPAGQVIVQEGDPADEIFIICTGAVEVLKQDSADQKQKIFRLGPQDMFGEFALLDGSARSATIRAAQDTRLLVISAAVFKTSIADDKIMADIFQGLARKLSDRLRLTNEVTAQALERELHQEQTRVAMGRFLMGMILMLCLYAFVVMVMKQLMAAVDSSTVVTLPLLVILVIVAVVGMKWLGYPMRFYGMTWLGWKKSLFEALLVTVPILLLTILVKWLLIQWLPAYQHVTLFNPYSYFKSIGANQSHFNFWLLMMVLYAVHSPLQELVVRGFLQSPLQEFFTGKYRYLLAIIVSNAVFSTFHLVHSMFLTIITFLLGIVWGWLYARHKCLVGVAVSHTIVGMWGVFVVGFGLN